MNILALATPISTFLLKTKKTLQTYANLKCYEKINEVSELSGMYTKESLLINRKHIQLNTCRVCSFIQVQLSLHKSVDST